MQLNPWIIKNAPKIKPIPIPIKMGLKKEIIATITAITPKVKIQVHPGKFFIATAVIKRIIPENKTQIANNKQRKYCGNKFGYFFVFEARDKYLRT